MGNMLIAQSGGPTAAVNASLAGAVERALQCPEIGEIFGARNGIEGVLKENFFPIRAQLEQPGALDLLRRTPAMALGSCRKRLSEDYNEEYEKLREIFHRHDIGYFFYIGGNDSMDTVLKLSAYFREVSEDIRVIGIPKTIDNDIVRTDHTPGFGSAARYIATSVSEIAADSDIYDLSSIVLIEIMGRNAGWLTAAAALARDEASTAPDIILMPEVPFEEYLFLRRVEQLREERQHLVIAVSEGIRYPGGGYVASADNVDPFGHRQLAGAARRLGFLLLEKFRCKVRSIELNVLQRAAGHLSSETDLLEAFRAGAEAVNLALAGQTGRMITLVRESDEPYRLRYDSADIFQIANLERGVPLDWIDAEHLDVTEDMLRYLRPLIRSADQKDSGLPEHFRF